MSVLKTASRRILKIFIQVNKDKNMKKAFILVPMVICFAGVAHAGDNESTIEQIGHDIFVGVTQTGPLNNNTSVVMQGPSGTSGDFLTTFIEQRGTANINSSTVEQDGMDAYADVLQKGENNQNDSYIAQDGIGNEVFVTQCGVNNMNSSQVDQTGAGRLNSAVVFQGGAGLTNSSVVVQDGSGLIAATFQH